VKQKRTSPTPLLPRRGEVYLVRLDPTEGDVRIHAPEGGLAQDSVVLTGQVRAIAKSRLLKRLGELQPETMKHIEQALKITLHLT